MLAPACGSISYLGIAFRETAISGYNYGKILQNYEKQIARNEIPRYQTQLKSISVLSPIFKLWRIPVMPASFPTTEF